jgi:hypothetical protein
VNRTHEFIEQFLDPDDPSVSYRGQLRLAVGGDDEGALRSSRLEIAGSPNVQRLLSRRQPDGTIHLGNEYHAYRKFQGTHWTLASLAELGYPPGDRSLLPLVDQVHEWLWAQQHLSPPSTEVLPGQEDRVRRCASQEGLAIWYLHELGLADDRVDPLASRLVAMQWPDGGWNCDKSPDARTSSFQETLLPLRGLARHVRGGRGDNSVGEAIERSADFLLKRRLLWRLRDGAPIRPKWGRDPFRIQWPFRWYDVLLVLVVMTELDRINDPRCADALALLAGKELESGGSPAEVRTARTVDYVVSGGTFAEWGPTGRTRPNPYTTIDATWVLRSVGVSPEKGSLPPGGAPGPGRSDQEAGR